jgi:ubiquinone/menaquinone biosynthesis C-methylase UbiE
MENAPYDGYYKYDRDVAQTYNQSRQNERHWVQEDRFVGMYIQSRYVEDLLDLPVGTGRFFKYYAGVRRVTGVDISEAMLTKAKEQLALLPNNVSVCLQQNDVFALPFKDAAFDAVIVFRLFHLMPETSLDQAIKELCRVCRKDVVAQTYPPIKKSWYHGMLSAIFRKITSLVKHQNPTTRTTLSSKPWSHIQAYYHEQCLIDAKFAMRGFLPSTSALLDKYENSEVRATVYSKTI